VVLGCTYSGSPCPQSSIVSVTVQLALTVLLVPAILSAIICILRSASPYMALYLWAFVVALQLIIMTIYPTLIAPLFNKYAPLEEGSLRTGIEKLASALKFPLKKLFVVDGSKRSGHSNAYMYGFGKNKRIVLYDTLLTQCNEDQVLPSSLCCVRFGCCRMSWCRNCRDKRPAFAQSLPVD
jgi:Zn-dependent protease with chaperone function